MKWVKDFCFIDFNYYESRSNLMVYGVNSFIDLNMSSGVFALHSQIVNGLWPARFVAALKNVGYHGWVIEKILGFEWPKTAQMALKFLCFFRKIFKYVSCLLKQFLPTFFFLQGFFS